MRKRLKRAACIWLMTGMMALVGCNEAKNDKADETTKQVVETKENDSTKDTTQDKSDEYPYGTFDFEEACKHIEINGKKVNFPFTLNDLGDDYEFVDCDEYVEGIYSGYIAYKGEKILTMSCEENDKLDRESIISDIGIIPDDVDNENVLNICGIEKGISGEQVIEIFGKPTEVSEDEVSGYYRYSSKKGFIRFSYYTEKSKVEYIKIIAN